MDNLSTIPVTEGIIPVFSTGYPPSYPQAGARDHDRFQDRQFFSFFAEKAAFAACISQFIGDLRSHDAPATAEDHL